MPKRNPQLGTNDEAVAHRRMVFVEEMIQHGNQTQAALSCGYAPGKPAESAGAKLAKDETVIRMLALRRRQMLDQMKLTSEEVLRSLARAVRFDARKLFRPDGTLKAITELDDDTALALQSFEVEDIEFGRVRIGSLKKVKGCDRNQARDQAMKHFGLYEKDNSQQNDNKSLQLHVSFVKPGEPEVKPA